MKGTFFNPKDIFRQEDILNQDIAISDRHRYDTADDRLGISAGEFAIGHVTDQWGGAILQVCEFPLE
ncbi:MAG: hypothetical protein HGB05_09050 [Chloroflexi bacterium]|nr:hypothetical protein [Chloroflexota bacterium]